MSIFAIATSRMNSLNKNSRKMEEIKQLDFNLLAGAFANDGWVMHHKFMAGNDWKKAMTLLPVIMVSSS